MSQRMPGCHNGGFALYELMRNEAKSLWRFWVKLKQSFFCRTDLLIGDCINTSEISVEMFIADTNTVLSTIYSHPSLLVFIVDVPFPSLSGRWSPYTLTEALEEIKARSSNFPLKTVIEIKSPVVSPTKAPNVSITMLTHNEGWLVYCNDLLGPDRRPSLMPCLCYLPTKKIICSVRTLC